MIPVIFIDYDGGYHRKPTELQSGLGIGKSFPDVIQALSDTKLEKYKIVIAINQSTVGRVLISPGTVDEINNCTVHAIHVQRGRIDSGFPHPFGPNERCIIAAYQTKVISAGGRLYVKRRRGNWCHHQRN